MKDDSALQCGAIEKRVSSLEYKSDGRDKQIAELRAAIADIGARLGNCEGANESAGAAISAIQSQQPPGLLAIAGPAIAGAVLVGSLGIFVLDQAVTPMKERMDGIGRQADMALSMEVDAKERLSKLEGAAPLIQYWVKDIDANGARVHSCGKDDK